MDFSEATIAKKYKVVVLGDSTVGKSAILNRFLEDTYQKSYQATVGSDLYTKTLVYEDEDDFVTMRLQIWDTAGDERFRSSIPGQIKDAAVAIVVYDICDKGSYKNCDQWIKRVREIRGDDCIVFLVGNKADASNLHRQVNFQKAQQVATENGIRFLEVSACAGYNIRSLFRRLGVALIHHQDLDISRSSHPLG